MTSPSPDSVPSDSAVAFARRFTDFIAASPSSYHAAAEVARRLEQTGFTREDERTPWKGDGGTGAVAPGGHFIVRGGAVVAWQIPVGADPATSGFRIVGAHTDSPGLKLKPVGDLAGPAGWRQAAVEIYGGAILPSWLDRELRIAGRIVLADGRELLVATGPVLRVPHLAVHLDRSVNTGLTLDRQRHMQPVLAVGADTPTVLDVVARAAVDRGEGTAGGTRTEVTAQDIVSHDLITVDAQHGEIFGAESDFIAAGRMDNLSSVFAGLEALRSPGSTGSSESSGSSELLTVASGGGGEDRGTGGADIRVFAAFDHEEVGSASASGAAGPVLEDVLVRIAAGLGASTDLTRAMYARSVCVSADAAHSVHPNYVGRYDALNHPVMNSGPVLKVNADQRYATDAVTAALWRRACAAAGVPCQVFASSNDVPCGSTIGPVTATRLGIPTVDVGIPLLSMHSAREMAGVRDLVWFTDALHAFWRM